ncbi:transcriptional regulator family: Fungal Specific TF [Aspergillus niger]|uniref:Contig An04c0140, genomic contig n=4 Tax=Aspergillus niger TaxID=5061 RepID=A2QIM9_ASPNC|nr:uncharacterized protein BO96DRAFT_454563 [Aspergillus niger CBS 101883]XP_059600520.1 uncharacterized protein An04g04080 [Aspergillus niger]RDH20295.1 hypothetical protein M747DRAFT_280409 [Aspergillus niger ATCC 13496]KAI2823000.1 transcriptional regulator family: Fungal Specific TF [Aspergillus niger]KAI2823276.1 transcriptional regulator family: Fungal Specific TF [Aspergillus niger]KAI2849037.1 transcriptional regulator family: Fungal Specific TF [Aspergillus niger]KAI2852856.1 transcr
MGKPSGGCGTCRARRVKCDETRPVCRRCRKARRTCSGYRDPHSVWFRDESDAVARRVKGSATLDTGSSSAESPILTLARRNTSSEYYPGQHTLRFPLAIVNFALDHTFQATCFFLDAYTWFNASKIVETSFKHGAGPAESLGQKAMMASIASVGLANLASMQRSSSMRLSARHEYTTALQLTNAALCDPNLVTADTTLTAIVCLSLFEIIACHKNESLDSWIEHSQGVATVLELRGRDQLRREGGFWMFQALRNEVVLGCLQKKTRLPSVLVDMPDQVAADLPPYPFPPDGDRLVKIMAKFTGLQADVREGILLDSSEIVKMAMAIDLELGHFASHASADFTYKVETQPGSVTSCEHDEGNFCHYQGTYHIYQSIWSCNIWNNYRYTRILVNSMILTHLRSMASSGHQVLDYGLFKDHCIRIRDLMRQLATDICCSIPFKFGVAGFDKKDVFDSLHTHAGTGFTLLLPLAMAALVGGVSSPMHNWAMRCFHVIGRGMGIGTASTLVTVLGNEPGGLHWIDAMESGHTVCSRAVLQ